MTDRAEEVLGEKLFRALQELDDELAPTIANVVSGGFAEDGKGFLVTCGMPDGTRGVWEFIPGQPVRYSSSE